MSLTGSDEISKVLSQLVDTAEREPICLWLWLQSLQYDRTDVRIH